MTASYGKWTVLSKLGSGGQADVYKVCETAAIESWHCDLRHSLQDLLHGQNPSIKSKGGDALYAMLHEHQYGPKATFGALKLLRQLDDDEARKRACARMKDEIEVLKQLDHPNLVKILDYSEAENWFVMEYLSGGTLEQAPDRFNEPCSALSAMSGIIEAVVMLHHRHRVHRDIKPANIFFRSVGDLVLGDLGLVFAADSDSPRVTLTAEKVGTRDFMPTWLLGKGRIPEPKPTWDVFALGKLIWWLLTPGKDVRLHYIDDEVTDIRKLHSRTRGINYFFEQLLKRSVVEHECNCLGDAGQLAEAVRDVQKLMHAEDARRCRMCSEGYYVHKRRTSTSRGHSPEMSYWEPPDEDSTGCAPARRSKTWTMFCDNCGHILEFRCEFECPWWVPILADDDGCVYG